MGISSKATSFSATANDIFRVADKYLTENELQWKACTDGKVRGFIASVKEATRKIRSHPLFIGGTTVAQRLKCCATNRKVADLIPAGVSGFFIDTKSFKSHYGPGVDSASNRNEYQEYFLGVKAASA